AALAAGGTVVWDATSLNVHQRSLVHAVARRRDALLTHAVALVDEAELIRRNGRRSHPVPPEVLTSQLHRFVPPYPGQAHRTWYIGASGTVEDRA
ncbi:AAA family ATPase, partial [Streptomyces sp. NPDC006510]|uniref:AAA family ATPase n=1 Tax=Streptomyces sp. NPDC006510 TaxID=3155600 RepID=UPI0033BAD2D4